MNEADIMKRLNALRDRLRSNDFRNSMNARRDILGELTGLLAFNGIIQTNVVTAADILSQPGFSSDMYERMLGRVDFFVGQAISEIEVGYRSRTIQGTKVFIGHGRSPLWKELKDFVQDRLGLDWDEFNRLPIAGIANVFRLNQMLNDACLALLVLTAEDEQADGRLIARQNVIHEAGLFQGRLGFNRAILLLEEGCDDFSNVHGLGQIRFPKGVISTTFEEVRRVMERERLITND